MLDPLFPLEPLRYGAVSIICGSLVILSGLFWMICSWHSLLTVSRGHPQEVLGFPLAPRTKRAVSVGPYSYTRNPMLFRLPLVGWSITLGSVSATFFSPLILVALLLLHFNFFEELALWHRCGEEYERYRHQVPLTLPFKRRVR